MPARAAVSLSVHNTYEVPPPPPAGKQLKKKKPSSHLTFGSAVGAPAANGPSAAAAAPLPPKPLRRNLFAMWSRAHVALENGDFEVVLIDNTAAPGATATAVEARKQLDRYMLATHRLQTEGAQYLRFCNGVHNGGWYDSSIEGIDAIEELMYRHAVADRKQAYIPPQPQPMSVTKRIVDEDGSSPAEVVAPPADPPAAYPHEDTDGKRFNAVGVGQYWPANQPNVKAAVRTQGADGNLTTVEAEGREKVVDGKMTDKDANWWLAHMFCWHGQTPFLVWHRPYMMLMERLLRYYDPADEETKQADPLCVPYFPWEEAFDGTACHPLFFGKQYDFFTEEFIKANGGAKSIPNPLLRWFAPASLRGTLVGKTVDDTNCTSREPAFTGKQATFSSPWRVVKDPADPLARYGAAETIRRALLEPSWCLVSAMEYSPRYSMEEAHNVLHIRIGGMMAQPGDELFDVRRGTMSTNQSPFDPVFWPHHCNVDRQLASWQDLHLAKCDRANRRPNPASTMASDRNRDSLMYPWAKPEAIAKIPANATPAEIIKGFIASKPNAQGGAPGGGNTSTLEDWFNTWDSVPYTYENLVEASTDTSLIPSADDGTVGPRRMLTLNVAVDRTDVPSSDTYALYLRGSPIADVSVLSGASSVTCSACLQKDAILIPFDVTAVDELQKCKTAGGLEKLLKEMYVLRVSSLLAKSDAAGTAPSRGAIALAAAGKHSVKAMRTIIDKCTLVYARSNTLATSVTVVDKSQTTGKKKAEYVLRGAIGGSNSENFKNAKMLATLHTAESNSTLHLPRNIATFGFGDDANVKELAKRMAQTILKQWRSSTKNSAPLSVAVVRATVDGPHDENFSMSLYNGSSNSKRFDSVLPRLSHVSTRCADRLAALMEKATFTDPLLFIYLDAEALHML